MAVETWSDDVRVAHLADDPQFADDLEQLIDAADARPADVVLDFAQVTFINSSNIADLLRLRKALGGDHKLICCQMDPAIRSALNVTGVSKLFPTVETVPMALAALQLT